MCQNLSSSLHNTSQVVFRVSIPRPFFVQTPQIFLLASREVNLLVNAADIPNTILGQVVLTSDCSRCTKQIGRDPAPSKIRDQLDAQMSASDAVDGSHPTASRCQSAVSFGRLECLLLAISGLFSVAPGMSALPPIADIESARTHRTQKADIECPLNTRKQTW
jgi:hypothetical protein